MVGVPTVGFDVANYDISTVWGGGGIFGLFLSLVVGGESTKILH